MDILGDRLPLVRHRFDDESSEGTLEVEVEPM
jgi:hypothetical protein